MFFIEARCAQAAETCWMSACSGMSCANGLHLQMHVVRSTDPAADLRIQLQKCSSRFGNTHMLIADMGMSRAGMRIRALEGPKSRISRERRIPGV